MRPFLRRKSFWIPVALGLLIAAIAWGADPSRPWTSSGAWNCPIGTCIVGKGDTDAIEIRVDDTSLFLGVTSDVLDLNADGTGTATYTGSDDAGAANTAYDTTTTGTITIGSADVTNVTVNSDVGLTFANNSDSINNLADGVFDFTIDEASPMTLTCSDDSGACDFSLVAGGTGAIIIGDSGDTSVSVTTDGGTVTMDGYVEAIMRPSIVLTAGTLTVNRSHIATAAGDYDLPDSCDTATGNWVTLIVQDASELVSLTVLAAEDEIKVGGIDAAANEEIDSPSAATSDGASITVACLQADVWYAVAQSGTWVDGGPAD